LLEIEKLGGAGFFIDDSKAWLGAFESFGEFTRLSNSPGTRGTELSLESDSVITVSLVTKGCTSTHPYFSIGSLINHLMMKDSQVIITHIYRQANLVVGWLAGYALSIPTCTLA